MECQGHDLGAVTLVRGLLNVPDLAFLQRLISESLGNFSHGFNRQASFGVSGAREGLYLYILYFVPDLRFFLEVYGSDRYFLLPTISPSIYPEA